MKFFSGQSSSAQQKNHWQVMKIKTQGNVYTLDETI